MSFRRVALAVALLSTLTVLAACAAPVEAPAATETTPVEEAGAAPSAAPQPTQPAPVPTPAIPAQISAVSGPVSATPLIVTRAGDMVTMPLSAIVGVVNAEFGIVADDRSLDFMAYVLDGELYVRASACPPCPTLAYSLHGGKLLCEACDTIYDAGTGAGIAGACVDYPKAAVPFEVSGDVVSIAVADLVRAWDETVLEGTGPLPEPVILAVEEPAQPVARPSCCG